MVNLRIYFQIVVDQTPRSNVIFLVAVTVALKGGTLRLQKQRELAVQKQNKGKLRDQ
jgi:hypothetical protein